MSQSLPVSPAPVTAPSDSTSSPAPTPSAQRRRRRGRPGGADATRPEGRLAIRLLQAVDVCFARIYHRVNVLAPQRLPKSGAAVLICNHTSALDPLLIQSVCPRLIVWMMAREYYEITALNWIFRTIEAIPVERGGRDLAATRAALRALEAGRILGVFPEGRIETSRQLLPFQTGVAMIAIKAAVPVYPAYLDGTQRGRGMLQGLLHRNVASLAFGPEVNFERSSTSKEGLQAATEVLAGAVGRLKRVIEQSRNGRRRAERWESPLPA
jgi:1-acyl-sn-glycerol-3-phosphate acyltransferase